jgi:adenylate cyclase
MEDKPEVTRFHGVKADEYWYGLLTGTGKGLGPASKFFRRIPHAPRCKLCQAPFAGPIAPFLRLIGFRRWPLNQQMCQFCVKGIEKIKGGTEISMSLLFADVRGSTTLAEEMPPAEFSASLDRFFSMAFDAIDSEDGIVDHIVGDGVMAMWVPGFVGDQHPQRALAAGRRLLSELAQAPDSFPVGVGVHTGTGYAGVVGEAGSYDFTVLGDVPNTVARLGSAAGPGELVISDPLAEAAGLETTGLERRHLELKGKADPFPAWIETASW